MIWFFGWVRFLAGSRDGTALKSASLLTLAKSASLLTLAKSADWRVP
jgi:hypothetical protein